MKNYYTITYQVVGGKRTDWVGIHAKNFADAVLEFTSHVFNIGGFEFTYNESAIINISQN